jgi:retinol dehydrogenase-14
MAQAEPRTDVPPMAGRVTLVTGASDGIGRATALGLARLGATVIMVCRDPHRGEAVRDVIRRSSGNPDVRVMPADLSSGAAIGALAGRFGTAHDRLHVLVNCAGVCVPERTLSVDGIELTFAVNHLAYFALTLLLIDRLRAGAPARIVNVTSAAEAMGVVDFEDLMSERRYRSLRAYNQSKLANVLFTYELARRLEGSGVTVNCLHPGLVRTKITRGMRGLGAAIAALERSFARTPAWGAEPVLYLACAPEVQGISGTYFIRKKAGRSSRRSHDSAVARRLWEVSEQLSGTSWSRSLQH